MTTTSLARLNCRAIDRPQEIFKVLAALGIVTAGAARLSAAAAADALSAARGTIGQEELDTALERSGFPTQDRIAIKIALVRNHLLRGRAA